MRNLADEEHGTLPSAVKSLPIVGRRRLEDGVALTTGFCLILAFGSHFLYLGELTRIQSTVLGIAGVILFPGLLVLPAAYFGPIPGFLLSVWGWVAISRSATRKWIARRTRSNGA